jgi:hypothetical protein
MTVCSLSVIKIERSRSFVSHALAGSDRSNAPVVLNLPSEYSEGTNNAADHVADDNSLMETATTMKLDGLERSVKTNIQ